MKIQNWNQNENGTYTVEITHKDETAIWTVTRQEWIKIRHQELDDEISNTDTSIDDVICGAWKALIK